MELFHTQTLTITLTSHVPLQKTVGLTSATVLQQVDFQLIKKFLDLTELLSLKNSRLDPCPHRVNYPSLYFSK